MLLFFCSISWGADISGTVTLKEKTLTGERQAESVTGVAVYLLPVDEATIAKINELPVAFEMLNQKNKQFIPQLLVVQKGAEVRFGNADPWFHNVYSNDPKFDLGRYPRGFWKKQVYTKTGVHHVYCDIHPNMHAVVYVVDTPYYTRTDEEGNFVLANIQPGSYQLVAWQIRSKPVVRDLSVTDEDITGIKIKVTETRIQSVEDEKNAPYSRSLLRKLK